MQLSGALGGRNVAEGSCYYLEWTPEKEKHGNKQTSLSYMTVIDNNFFRLHFCNHTPLWLVIPRVPCQNEAHSRCDHYRSRTVAMVTTVFLGILGKCETAFQAPGWTLTQCTNETQWWNKWVNKWAQPFTIISLKMSRMWELFSFWQFTASLHHPEQMSRCRQRPSCQSTYT